MPRIEPTFGSVDSIASRVPSAVEVLRLKNRAIHARVAVLISLMLFLLALFLGIGAFGVATGRFGNFSWVRYPQLLAPLCVLCVIGAFLALSPGRLGIAASLLCSASVAAYLYLSVPTLSGGLVYSAFIFACALVNAAYLRAAT